MSKRWLPVVLAAVLSLSLGLGVGAAFALHARDHYATRLRTAKLIGLRDRHDVAVRWNDQLASLTAGEPTATISSPGVYAARIVDVDERGKSITFEWVGVGHAGRLSDDVAIRQTLVPLLATELLVQAPLDPNEAGMRSAPTTLEPARIGDFYASIRSRDATGARYLESIWWVSCSSDQDFFQLVQAPE